LRTARPRGRRTDPHGVARASRGSGASGIPASGSGDPGRPFRRRPGIPTRTADRHPSKPVTPLLASRAPPGHTTGGSTPVLRPDGHPPGLLPPSAHEELRVRYPRALPRPATFRPRRFSRPRRLPPRNPVQVYFALVTPVGLSSSGPSSAPVIGSSLEARGSLAVAPDRPAVKRGASRSATELCSHRSIRTAEAEKPARPLPS
jgi:hypothetical protein